MPAASRLHLPDAPPDQSAAPVRAWRQPVTLDTYLPAAPEPCPMFLEKRVYQGSSGRVYPLPVVERIAENSVPHAWDAIHIENEYLRLMILPDIGGRIHVGLDKANGYDFFYRQNVIKPALVGLAGPWISGGVEFNWPQHHRPSTFMPTDIEIERHSDGSITVWCSEHEPMNRMKGMHGVCLHPGTNVIELKARVFNRTELTQTFLWWANVATRVHEHYQSFFPPDVHYVADHAKRAMSAFPLCTGRYYGVDYAARAAHGVPADETPRCFVPPAGNYPPNDLSWYANIPVPTSYMAMGSREDFFGGYDHAARAGLIHFADRRIAPGKKQWTWGNHDFGYAWDRHLTDNDGPYIELMAGVYTDNQPDFSYLAAGETRTWSQFWYPIQKIGPAIQANLDAALSLARQENATRVGIAATRPLANACITVFANGTLLKEWQTDLGPDRPFFADLPDTDPQTVAITVTHAAGQTLLSYTPASTKHTDIPPAAKEPALPAAIATTDELYLIGLHLEQYRHATRMPEEYWREALRREPDNIRCNTAMGWFHYRRGEFPAALAHFQRAVDILTRWNPNPRDGEAHYGLGLTLARLNRPADAYDAFAKSAWNYAFQSPAFFELARLDCKLSDWSTAEERLRRVLAVNHDHLQARDLLAIVLRRLLRFGEADRLLAETLRLDPLDHWARHIAGKPFTAGLRVALDIAWDLLHAGMYAEALTLLQHADAAQDPKKSIDSARACSDPDLGAPLLTAYLQAYLHHLAGNAPASAAALQRARALSPEYCFPARLDEAALLEWAAAADPDCAHPHHLLGNWLYDRKRHRDAIDHWQSAAAIDPANPIISRNLGIGYFNILHDPTQATEAYDRSFAAAPTSARILYERDQLWKRLAEPPAKRLAELEKFPSLTAQRDDLALELATLYNDVANPAAALRILTARRFQPWEGGEGLALGQYVRAQLALGRDALQNDNPGASLAHFQSALSPPENLGEARHLLANQSDIHYWLGKAHAALGNVPAARHHFTAAAHATGDFQEMSVREYSPMSFYSALALRELGRQSDADNLLDALAAYGQKLIDTPAKIDYFATSLPTMLLFDDDLQQRAAIEGAFLIALSHFGLHRPSDARPLLENILRQNPAHAGAHVWLKDDLMLAGPAANLTP
ncbi:MAG TPA: DUF5107 domain-containing protein [Phycisphaerae bacterium]|nr:DUF5107 domain-containing protein [Phycisphaerae bacterium]